MGGKGGPAPEAGDTTPPVGRSESALLMPVPEAERAVDSWRRRQDPARAAGVPAHITILYPFLDPDALTEDVLGELRSLFAAVEPFEFALVSVGDFPGVVYLRPDPDEPFVRLTAAVATLWPDLPPYGGAFERTVPHLTVAHDAATPDAVTASLAASLPLSARGREVWLMVSKGGRWKRKYRFPLSAPAG